MVLKYFPQKAKGVFGKKILGGQVLNKCWAKRIARGRFITENLKILGCSWPLPPARYPLQKTNRTLQWSLISFSQWPLLEHDSREQKVGAGFDEGWRRRILHEFPRLLVVFRGAWDLSLDPWEREHRRRQQTIRSFQLAQRVAERRHSRRVRKRWGKEIFCHEPSGSTECCLKVLYCLAIRFFEYPKWEMLAVFK